MADPVLSELAGQRGRLILVIDDRHEPTSHELTSPDALAQLTRLLTNVEESAAEPRVRARLTARALAWYRGGEGARAA